MGRWVQVGLVAVCVAACGSGGSGGADAAVALDGGLCEAQATRVCEDGVAYFQDSCGNLGDRIEECEDARPCNEDLGACCAAPVSDGQYMDAPEFTLTTWSSPGPSAELAIDFEVASFATGGQAQALRYQVQIDDTELVFGLRADLADAGEPGEPGIEIAGYIGSEDLANLEADGATFINSGPDGGGFVRLNRGVDLGPRTAVGLRIVREEDSGGADWFAVYGVIDGAEEDRLGRILIPRGAGGTAARFAGGEHRMVGKVLRANPFTVADVGKVQVSVSIPSFDGDPATGAELSYPLLPPDDAPFPNADVTYDVVNDRVVVTQGGLSPKCSEPGSLF